MPWAPCVNCRENSSFEGDWEQDLRHVDGTEQAEGNQLETRWVHDDHEIA